MTLCLGIESSCDETSMALVDQGRLLGQATSTQIEVHALFGGVVPEIASREHYRLLDPLYRRLLSKTGVDPKDIGVVSVARGPGLLGSLLVGVGFAKGLALGLGTALVGVNHLHAHLMAPGLERELIFPALGLLVSGGHTDIYLMESETSFHRLGRTLDDAAGEAFDKVAAMLGLPYPGGRQIDELACQGRAYPNLFPRPYLVNRNLDFSFSGLKTAVSVYLSGRTGKDFGNRTGGAPDPENISRADLCASFNHAVAETLRIKTERALKRNPGVRALVTAGGVAANSLVRGTMATVAEKSNLPLLIPSLELCTDNGAMIAYTGECLFLAGLRHGFDLEAIPRGRPVPWDYGSAPSEV